MEEAKSVEAGIRWRYDALPKPLHETSSTQLWLRRLQEHKKPNHQNLTEASVCVLTWGFLFTNAQYRSLCLSKSHQVRETGSRDIQMYFTDRLIICGKEHLGGILWEENYSLCARSVVVIGAESGTVVPSSNFSRERCVHFRINTKYECMSTNRCY